MKFVLSRKGADSQFGGKPSPVLPDGTMLSLPIPEQNTAGVMFDSNRKFEDLALRGFSGLSGYCHLDPDIRKELYKSVPENWVPCFGQCDAAQTHLSNNEIGAGDVFLFFGLFQKVDANFNYTGKPFHALWGYMQVDKVISDPEEIKEYSWHPHAQKRYQDKSVTNNTLYVGSEFLSFGEGKLPGYGVFNWDDRLALTKKDSDCLTHWDYESIPWVNKESGQCNMTYHTAESSFCPEYFQSASRGQEFVITESATPVVEKRLLEILLKD